jgi:hypothetical protein
VLSGWLLTVANTGDSNAVIDCGDDVQEITFSHRIQVCGVCVCGGGGVLSEGDGRHAECVCMCVWWYRG